MRSATTGFLFGTGLGIIFFFGAIPLGVVFIAGATYNHLRG